MINQSKKKLTSKQIFKIELFMILLALLIFIAKTALGNNLYYLNCDNYFQLSHGKYVLNNGFPIKEPLRMHNGFDFMVPQWLFSILLSLIYFNLGPKAVILIMILPIIIINAILLFSIASRITNKNANSLLIAGLFYILQLLFYSYIRPYLFTLCFALIEVLLFEICIEKKEYKFFIILPFISVLQINFHNSLWIVLILIQMCYYARILYEKFISKEKECIPLKYMILTTIGICVFAMINPYGIKYITYIFPSFVALEPFKSSIRELCSPIQIMPWLMSIYILDILVLIHAFRKKRTIPIQFLFMFIGFGIMFLTSIRNGIFFFSLGQIFLIYYSKYWNKDILFNYESNKIILTLLLCLLYLYSSMQTVQIHKNTQSYKAVDWLYAQEGEVITSDPVFTTFDIGSYAGFKGYRVYMDTCAEIYGKAVNHKKDIAKEITSITNSGSISKFEKFVNHYKFKYCIVDNYGMAAYVKSCPEYKMIYGKFDDKKTTENNADASSQGGWIFERIQ